MICRYCGRRVVWMEGQGWCIRSEVFGTAIYGTTTCENRPFVDGGPTAGHRLKKEEEI